MSLFVAVPDGFYHTSRIDEQLKAVSKPDQFTIRDILIVTTIVAASLGVARAAFAVVDQAAPAAVQPAKK